MTQTLLLMTGFKGAEFKRLKEPFASRAKVLVVSTMEQLDAAPIDADTTLLSFGTGIIAPAALLSRLKRPAYNVHAASPEFPGRDPHHHAIYRGATTYGATLHLMVEKVDAGDIVAVETFPVETDATPRFLLDAANEAGLRLIERVGLRLLDGKPLPPLSGVSWGPVKTARSDLLRLCRISPLIGAEELERRYRAFDGGSHDNLTVDIHGRTFRIDKHAQSVAKSSVVNADFTETAFRGLLRQLKSGGYRFARHGEAGADRHVIWRHDVDFSMHRAAKLAAIEAEEGAVATYFVNPRCTFYNLFEPEISALLRRIRALGHQIGLHFDAGAFGIEQWTRDALEPAIERERKLVEMALDAPVGIMSWHNPDMSNLLEFDADDYCGVANTYAARLRREYAYCSDSNGYWRFKPMPDVIAEGHARLHLLTHPEWWTPEPMPPSDRVDRAITGRARRVRADYDALLARGGRRNVIE